MSDNLQSLLDQIDALKAEIDALPPISDRSKDELWRKYRLEWNYNSNHLEGNTLTYSETELLLIFDKVTGDHTTREVDEMRGHDVAIKLVTDWALEENRLINQADIRNLNEILLVRPFYADAITTSGQKTRRLIVPGKYKELPNHVKLQSGETFYYAEPHEVESKMHDLLKNYEDVLGSIHPVMLAAKLHYEFVLIHPFDDGNGRVSRLLMNYHLLRNDLAPIIIKSDNKGEYLTALNKADSGDFNSFAAYIAKQELWSLELKFKATTGESIEEEEDWKKKLELLNSTSAPIREIAPPRSPEIILKRQIDSFQKLYDGIVEEISIFKPRVYDIAFTFRLFTANNKEVDYIDISQTSKEEVENRLKDIKTDRYVIISYINYINKENKLTEDRCAAIVLLNKFDYTLQIQGSGTGFQIKKRYSESLSNDEIKIIINDFGKYYFNLIVQD